MSSELAKVCHASVRDFKDLLDKGTYVVIDTRNVSLHVHEFDLATSSCGSN